MPDQPIHETMLPFSREGAASIRRMAAAGQSPMPCPRCGKGLEIGDGVAEVDNSPVVRSYRCMRCRQMLMLVRRTSTAGD